MLTAATPALGRLWRAAWYRVPIPGTEWKLVQTNRGRTYYYHPPTKKTSWTPPDEVKKAMEQLEEEEERAAPAEPEPPQPAAPAPVAPPAAPAPVPDLKRKPEEGAEGEREDADAKRPRPADAPAAPPAPSQDPAEAARCVGRRRQPRGEGVDGTQEIDRLCVHVAVARWLDIGARRSARPPRRRTSSARFKSFRFAGAVIHSQAYVLAI